MKSITVEISTNNQTIYQYNHPIVIRIGRGRRLRFSVEEATDLVNELGFTLEAAQYCAGAPALKVLAEGLRILHLNGTPNSSRN